jgi:hypothetical protein
VSGALEATLTSGCWESASDGGVHRIGLGAEVIFTVSAAGPGARARGALLAYCRILRQ